MHGALHACLRALFGVSVAGILACIFSCMLVYQLLSHEKKKMYWEQLELRCRSLYGQGGGVGPAGGSCGCCNDCGGASPWWAQTPGNLYTPNPDLAPSRFVESISFLAAVRKYDLAIVITIIPERRAFARELNRGLMKDASNGTRVMGSLRIQ